MPIYYALVAKDQGVVLTEYTDCQGNSGEVAKKLMSRIQENTMKTFELEEYYFHYINEYNVTVLCMTDKKMEKRLAFAFLQDVKKTLLEAYSTRELQLASQNSLTAFRDQIRDKTVSGLLLCDSCCVAILELEPGRLRGQDRPAGFAAQESQ